MGKQVVAGILKNSLASRHACGIETFASAGMSILTDCHPAAALHIQLKKSLGIHAGMILSLSFICALTYEQGLIAQPVRAHA